MIRRVKETAPRASISGVTIQKMIEDIDYEIILGAKKDRDFGSVILFGMGGVGTEIFKDISIGIPPLNQTLARRLMEETEVYKILQGYRGKSPADMAQIEQIIVNLSNLIIDFPEIAEMDINPIAIANGRAFAIDARIIIDKECIEYTSQYPHLVITPYPARYVMTWKMLDGTEVTLRPIKPEDEPLEHELLSTLSQETTRTRFFSIIKDITHEMLVHFCNIDYDREMAIVAELKQDGKKRIIGIGRLIVEPDFKNAEYAVLVHDNYQGKGLGYKLVDILIGIAQDKGLEGINGVVLTENNKMLIVAKKLGFTSQLQPDGITKVQLALK
jgi:acetyltransferase